MATVRSGLFTLKEFSYRRNVLKLAPDAFVVINGALTSRVLSPMESKGTKDIDIRGGIVSVNVSAAVSPPGASRASIEIIAPMYKGLHEDYYISMPNGTRVPFFIPMMEVKIYMKGRYLESEYNYTPRYYPVFWGMITNVQENYSDGNFTISISCEDFLCWWKYQKITINPSVQSAFFGGATQLRFPSVFEKMSAWEIIYSLFTDSFFTQHGENGAAAFYNFVYPSWSKSAELPSSIIATRDTFGPLASNVIEYWNKRFGFGVTNSDDPSLIKEQLEKVPLKMYGLRGPISFETVKNKLLTFLDNKDNDKQDQTDTRAKLDLDFGLLARVQPYGLFGLFGNGAEATIFSKLEIATSICEKTFMEFFVDTNGEIVFKPPFYNLDVASGNVPYYRVGPNDVINYNASFDSNSIINYLVVTGPRYQSLESLEAIGFHADFASIAKMGIRSDQVSVPYGMNAKQLKMIAAAEMARRNGQAYTGSVSIPLRPEIRLGYPVYLEHVDTFYYVTGINHNFTFGSAATTDLSLQFKREKIFDDGNSRVPNSVKGDVLYSCVLRDKESEVAKLAKTGSLNNTEIAELIKDGILSDAQMNLKTLEIVNRKIDKGELPKYKDKVIDIDKYINDLKKQIASEESGVYSGPGILGLWRIERAKVKERTQDQINQAGDDATFTSNELVMITDDSVPYTDKLGYRHIGTFPYGANLVLTKNGQMRDMTTSTGVINQEVDIVLNASGLRDEDCSCGVSSEANQGLDGELESVDTYVEESPEVVSSAHSEYMDDLYKNIDDKRQAMNPQSNPNMYNLDKPTEGLVQRNDIELATRTMIDVPSNNLDPCTRETNQNESTHSG